MAEILISREAQEGLARFPKNLQDEAHSHLRDVDSGRVKPRFLRGISYSRFTRTQDIYFFWDVGEEAEGRQRLKLLSIARRPNLQPG